MNISPQVGVYGVQREGNYLGREKPRLLETLDAENPLFVCISAPFMVDLKTHTTLGQVVYGLLNVVDREIKDSKGCWSMVGLRIHQDVPPASNMES